MKQVKFDVDTFWKRENAYFFQVGEAHVAAVVPMGKSCLVLEYWEVLEGEHKGEHQHGMSFMSEEQTTGFMAFAGAIDSYFADKAAGKLPSQQKETEDVESQTETD